ncbi:MAG: glutathione S-transferase N-terminal domain-containing protein [Immundisolibacter sp.]|uniref:glutathione S-transferase N-terminal domain-containing protein n=1 Tax=Immundisolibacter sp. TaxID=1934948 RepID=UPI003D0ABE73
MIELHMWPTPNAHKVTLFLEETGLPYRTVEVNIGAGDQFKPAFLAISPNNKMPAIVDPDGPDGRPISVFESGAILLYLAEKTGRFLPADARGRYEVLQWLMFQMASVGPMLGQAHHFRDYAPEKLPYAIDRYTNESRRIYRVVDTRLKDRDYVAGEYSIADMAIYPWFLHHEREGVDIGELSHVRRWMDAIGARPATQRGLAVMAERRPAKPGPQSEAQRQILFGSKQYERH